MTVHLPPGWLENAGATHTAAQLRSYLGSLITGSYVTSEALKSRGGVHPQLGRQLAVSQTPTPSMAVIVGNGIAWIPGTESGTQGSYCVLNDADVTVSIATAHGSLPRIDIVQIRVRDSFYSGTQDDAVIDVKTGTPASSPVAPTPDPNALVLAEVLVGAGVSSIVNANITDKRRYLAAAGGVLPYVVAAPVPTTEMRQSQLLWALDGSPRKLEVFDGTATQTIWQADWISYTPTWSAQSTAPSLGNGSLIGRYMKIGRTVYVFIRLTVGSTTTFGTGSWSFSLPFPPQFEFQPLSALARDDSVLNTHPLVAYTRTGPQAVFLSGHGTTGAIGQVDNDFPVTSWAAGDVISVNGMYIATS